jgi:hypothetical protein
MSGLTPTDDMAGRQGDCGSCIARENGGADSLQIVTTS